MNETCDILDTPPARVMWQRPVRTGGFTLVEILIVVVILGILGTLVIPQFSNASHQARENTLKDDLRYLRTQIQVYKAQHRDKAPGSNGDFVQQLTRYTNDDGDTNAAATSAYRFGPYLSKMPKNPLNEKDTIELVASGDLKAAADGSHGWIYNPNTGEIIADLTGKDSNDQDYSSY